jgi:predicted  nucleic acid-binding Zn-ribbon protein
VSSREELLEQMESQLNIWRTQIAQLSDRSENLDEATKKEIDARFGNLQVQIREFQDRMGAISNSNKDAWRELKNEVESISNEVGKAIGQIASTVTDLFNENK